MVLDVLCLRKAGLFLAEFLQFCGGAFSGGAGTDTFFVKSASPEAGMTSRPYKTSGSQSPILHYVVSGVSPAGWKSGVGGFAPHPPWLRAQRAPGKVANLSTSPNSCSSAGGGAFFCPGAGDGTSISYIINIYIISRYYIM